MKLTIERAALLKALGHVQSVVERRTTIPILSNVLLHAEAGRLALSATDMDLEIAERVPTMTRASHRGARGESNTAPLQRRPTAMHPIPSTERASGRPRSAAEAPARMPGTRPVASQSRAQRR